MQRMAVAVYSVLLSAISRLKGLSGARVSLKFMIALLAVMLPCSVVIFTANLRATTNIIMVTSTADPASTSGNGFCTLREAINNFNSPAADTTGGDCAVGSGSETIVFSVSGTITLGSTLPTVHDSPGTLTIDGTGQTITIDGANSFEVLNTNINSVLNLNNLTIAHGSASGGAGGGGVDDNGTLTVTNCTFSGNTNTGSGGGIGSFFGTKGPVTITNSTFSGNSAVAGGGISAGTVTVTNSTFSNNSAAGDLGGGISAGTVTVPTAPSRVIQR